MREQVGFNPCRILAPSPRLPALALALSSAPCVCVVCCACCVPLACLLAISCRAPLCAGFRVVSLRARVHHFVLQQQMMGLSTGPSGRGGGGGGRQEDPYARRQSSSSTGGGGGDRDRDRDRGDRSDRGGGGGGSSSSAAPSEAAAGGNVPLRRGRSLGEDSGSGFPTALVRILFILRLMPCGFGLFCSLCGCVSIPRLVLIGFSCHHAAKRRYVPLLIFCVQLRCLMPCPRCRLRLL
jgi:hypothetical protein